MKSSLKEIIKLPFKPYWALRKKLRTVYMPRKYWNELHSSKNIDSLQRVGYKNRSEEENRAMYEKARQTFIDFCQAQGVVFSEMKVLEIGCGTGFYTDIIKNQGCKNYTGIDISRVTVKQLKEKYPNCKFKTLDAAKGKLKEKFDVIVMIDVTQHIVGEKKFVSAMKNIDQMLRPGGIFIVTSWLSEQIIQNRYYEVKRPLSCYKQAFADYKFSKPAAFRDKYIFSISKQG
ncbi:putative S-adenosylmethionine-dependent methyltransferase/MSMEI_2290 [Sedimentisphaera cyanobacteriorum]|uniref:Putative S-adenosylmethionine-dependent methyltransferase/MSMEI_2290 n=1 Tax=Sedimentisphaera cyanobacteriorum TaxID=1940790 RepID=A0A1Q2HS91_9BACT|nr:class I SAM-dependent methyltransferase [Sedimentisphaera cyanobacteriorum]AQQ10105.1 putative S-adenosylmethionine-dependent methyltransferase/MSMEI_2290 [Sedimentisphaera cyanobacteriorum]